jgi:hypothetical protein
MTLYCGCKTKKNKTLWLAFSVFTATFLILLVVQQVYSHTCNRDALANGAQLSKRRNPEWHGIANNGLRLVQ